MTRLTEPQLAALSCASLLQPIYLKGTTLPKGRNSQRAFFFDLRAINSLVQLGYLKSDGSGGYLLTPQGAKNQRKIMAS